MNEISAFPKIFSLGKPVINRLFDDEVEITEKIDGSQFTFGKIDGQLHLRSEGASLYPENPEKMFIKGIDYICSIKDRLPDNYVFYGEFLSSPKHNTLEYFSVPKNNIILFGCQDLITGCFFECNEIQELVEEYSLDLSVVPVLFKGVINMPNYIKSIFFEQILERKSILGGVSIEGFVVKNYNKNISIGDSVYPVMSGKLVSEKFKEIHKMNQGSTDRHSDESS